MFLSYSVFRRTERIAERQIIVDIARDTAVFNDIHGRADDNRGNASGFKYAGRQTDGLMANGSQGDKYGDIDFVLNAGRKNGRRV